MFLDASIRRFKVVVKVKTKMKVVEEVIQNEQAKKVVEEDNRMSETLNTQHKRNMNKPIKRTIPTSLFFLISSKTTLGISHQTLN